MYCNSEIAKLLGIAVQSVRERMAKVPPAETGIGNGGVTNYYWLEQLPPDWQARLQELQAEEESRALSREAAQYAAERGRPCTLERYEVVDEFLAWRRQQGLARGYQTYLAQHQELALSAKTLKRWVEAFQAEGVTGLARVTAPQDAEEDWPLEARDYLRALYLHTNRPPAQSCIRRLRAQAKEQGWPLPSDRTLHRYIKTIPMALVIQFREGKTAYVNKVLPSALRDNTFVPNQRWVTDHKHLDLFVTPPEGGAPVRPWITVFQDLGSRRIPGWNLCRTPDGVSIATALKRGVQRCGVPDEILQDNGQDYSSKMIAGGYKKFRGRQDKDRDTELKGIYHWAGVQRVRFCLPANGRAKPVERFFRTMDADLCKFLPGYVGENTLRRPEDAHQEIQAGKVITWAELESKIEAWITQIYEQNAHNGAGMEGQTPMQVWNSHWESGAVMRKPIAAALTWLFKPYREVKVGRYGVRLFKQQYFTPELHQHFGELVKVSFDPDDLSRVFCHTSKGDPIGFVPLLPVGQSWDDLEGFKASQRLKKEARRLNAAQAEVILAQQRRMSLSDIAVQHSNEVLPAAEAQVVEPVRTPFDQGDPDRGEPVREARPLAVGEDFGVLRYRVAETLDPDEIARLDGCFSSAVRKLQAREDDDD